jgi:hypothetical protein
MKTMHKDSIANIIWSYLFSYFLISNSYFLIKHVLIIIWSHLICVILPFWCFTWPPVDFQAEITGQRPSETMPRGRAAPAMMPAGGMLWICGSWRCMGHLYCILYIINHVYVYTYINYSNNNNYYYYYYIYMSVKRRFWSIVVCFEGQKNGDYVV